MKKYFQKIYTRLILIPFFKIIKKTLIPSERIIKKLKFRGEFEVVTKDNKKFYLYNNSFYLENSIFWLGIDKFKWENVTRQIWAQLSQHSEVIFDIGANTGIFSVLSKVYNKNSKVYSFEPQPNIFKILKRNNQINKFDIKCENIALSNYSGKSLFYNYGKNTFDSKNTTAGSLNQDWRKDNQFSIKVFVSTLNDYITEYDIKNIHLMKIDVETLEFEVLLGFNKFLHQFKPIIILEIQNSLIGNNITTLFNKLTYCYFNINEHLGLVEVNSLTPFSNENRNFLLCPKQKLNVVKNISINI